MNLQAYESWFKEKVMKMNMVGLFYPMITEYKPNDYRV